MFVQMGSQGQAGFDQPIELLMDCHRRIEHFLESLLAVVEKYGDEPLDAEARSALETSLNYLFEAAPRHTADEEVSLFPRLRQIEEPHVQAVMAVLDRLEDDHRRAESAHARIDEIGRHWLVRGHLNGHHQVEIQRLLRELTKTYTQHIKLEDEEVFVLASRVLDQAALHAVGVEMRGRRVKSET